VQDLETTRCACGHVYDEHDDGQECQVEIVLGPNPYGLKTDRCKCVYFEAADPDEDNGG
jgi:hypothetical protein